MLWLYAPNSLFSLSQISSYIRFGTRLSHAQTSQIVDSNKYLVRLIISQLEQMAMQCEMLYYFSWFMAGLFTQQSVYSYISNCSWKNKLSGI